MRSIVQIWFQLPPHHCSVGSYCADMLSKPAVLAQRALMLCPKLGKLMAELTGAEGTRIWHDAALYKKPWANPTSLHADNPRWSFTSPDAISLWVALEETNMQK